MTRMHAAARLLALLLSAARDSPAGRRLQRSVAGARAQRGQIFEIIVTAQKRAENVQDVPIAMQAYTRR